MCKEPPSRYTGNKTSSISAWEINMSELTPDIAPL